MEEYIKINIKGLSDNQIKQSNKEIEDEYKKQYAEPVFTKDGNNNVYKINSDYFKTDKEISKDLLLKSVQFYFSIRRLQVFYSEEEIIIDKIVELTNSLIENKWKDDHDEMMSVCNKIKEGLLFLLEEVYDLKKIVVIYKIGKTINAFLN